MCMSPHEMTSATIEERIERMEEWVAQGAIGWQRRIDQFRELLKERANDGTYHTAGEYS